MIVSFRVSHWQCDLYAGPVFIAKMPGTVGKEATKRPSDRARDRQFNHWLANVWADRIARGGTRYNAPLHALEYLAIDTN